MTVEHSIRKIIGANYGYKPTTTLAKKEIVKDGNLQKIDEIVGVNVTFHYKNGCNSFIKLLDLKKHSYIRIPHQDEKTVDVLLIALFIIVRNNQRNAESTT